MPQLSDRSVDRLRRRCRRLVDACAARGERWLAGGQVVQASEWLRLGARIASTGGFGRFVSPRLEHLALAIAQTLPPVDWPTRAAGPRRLLHVFTGAYEVGGHTAFVRRWIENDRSTDLHRVLLTARGSVPSALRAAVEGRGGEVLGPDGPSLMGRIGLLQRAARDADLVILHHHQWDTVPILAFGRPGGPPVLTVNQLDHNFWLGASITDLALNHRPVGADLNCRYRSIGRNADLPIRLVAPPDSSQHSALRVSTRQSLGIPEDAVVFVTIAREPKYRPIGELDFPLMASRLLGRLPAAYLIAIGPRGDRREWRRHIGRYAPRMMVLGSQLDVAPYHAAADIYLESFPFDSTTATLEAALARLPVVPVPRVAPLPFSAHGGVKATIPQPASIDAYLDDAVRLAQSASLRRARAAAFAEAVEQTSLGESWRAFAEAALAAAPQDHRIHPVDEVPIDDDLDRFLVRMSGGARLYHVRRFLELALRDALRGPPAR